MAVDLKDPKYVAPGQLSCFMIANLAYLKVEKRGSRDRSSLPSDQDLYIAALPESDAAILILTTPARPSRDHVRASSNGFRAAVYDQHRPRYCVS